MKRREFIRSAVTSGASLALSGTVLGSNLAGSCRSSAGKEAGCSGGCSGGGMKLFWEPYQLEMAHTFTVASYSRKTTPDVQVRIEYEGLVGYGEASMPPYLGHTVDSVCAFLGKVDLSQFGSPLLLEDIHEYLEGLSEGDAPAKAAVDIALHDLCGKILGAPLYRIWGLNPEKAGDTTFTIGIDTPEVVKAKTLECEGKFNILKVKVGLDSDYEMIRTIREVTSLPLAVDANQGWKDRTKALEEIQWLHKQGVVMVEQPMPKDRPDDIAWITERSPIPVFADESVQNVRDIPGLKGVYSGINIKLMKCGGIVEARRMITLARSLGMKVMLGCMTETSCAVTAAAHLSPLADFCDLDGNLLITNDLFRGMVVRSGSMVLPDGPGLGLVEIFG